MESNSQQERQQAHALLDLLPPAKLGAVRNLLEVMVEGGESAPPEPVSDEDRRRFHEGQAFFASGKGIPMESVLGEFGLKPEDFPLNK
jgi:hypothetical protein